MFTGKRNTTVKLSRRLQAKGEMSTRQTGKDTNIQCERFISLRDLMIKMLSGNEKYIFSRFQLYARAYVRVAGRYAPVNSPR